MFQGPIVALVTPFRDGAIDWNACADLVERQVLGGISALVVSGTTGEAPTLSGKEKTDLLRFVVERARDRVPVIAGTGSYDTREVVEQTVAAGQDGAAGVLVVAPYYNKPGVEGLRRHFLTVADASAVPLILYDIPSRTGCSIPPSLSCELFRHPRIVAVKDASGSLAVAMELVQGGVPVLSGDDANTLAWMAVGGCGVVSVAANVVPEEVSRLVATAAASDLGAARHQHYRLLPLFRALFAESNPAPVKELMALLGRCQPEVRLPLVEVSEETRQLLQTVWNRLNEPQKASDSRTSTEHDSSAGCRPTTGGSSTTDSKSSFFQG